MPPNLRAGVCVGGAIFAGDALLLLHWVPDLPGLWELPGGSVEEGERLKEALRREVREETGLVASAGPSSGASTLKAEGREGRRIPVVAIEFLGSTTSPGPVHPAPEEYDRFAWVRADDLDRYPLVPGFARAVPEALHALDALCRGSRR